MKAGTFHVRSLECEGFVFVSGPHPTLEAAIEFARTRAVPRFEIYEIRLAAAVEPVVTKSVKVTYFDG